MLRVAVIGLGDVSYVHLGAIQSHKQVNLVATCDIDEAKNTIEGTNFYTDYNEMLEKEELDCVHICLPHHLHYPVTKACVEKGIHVFLEKPLAHDLKSANKIVQLEKDYPNVKICVCLQNRLNESVEVLLEEIESGKYGKITGVKGLVTWYRPESYYATKPWRAQMDLAGGGVMINQSIHTLDLVQLFGGDIQSIRGSIDILSDYDIEVEDTATAKINFKNGATGLFFATVVNAGNSSVELQVTFEKGKLTIKDSILTRVDSEGKKKEMIEDAKLPGTKFYYGASHAKLIHQFYQCIEKDGKNYIHAKDALISMRVIEAIRRSSETKKEVLFETI